MKLISVLSPLTNLSAHPATEKVVYNRNRTIQNTIIPTEIKNCAGEVQVYPRTNQLDPVIEEVIKKWISANSELATTEGITLDKLALYRMATMGRLAEMGEVKWEIIDRESVYSIPT